VSRSEAERLRDISDAIVAIRGHIERTRDLDDPLLHDALLFQFVVIGEAVKALSEETCARAPEISWGNIAGLRDLIAHEYFRIEMSRVLDIVDRDLPALEDAIEQLLSDAD
jgi:uncharacterized protein with HEPN domain